MKSREERVLSWTWCSTRKNLALWQTLDFEKIFKYENSYRGKYQERLEAFMDTLVKLAKRWERDH